MKKIELVRAVVPFPKILIHSTSRKFNGELDEFYDGAIPVGVAVVGTVVVDGGVDACREGDDVEVERHRPQDGRQD